MQPTKHNAITSTDKISQSNLDQPAVTTGSTASLTDYIQDHKLPGSAANDPHQLALADFLIEHMRQRANAQPEPTEEDESVFEAQA